MTDSVRRVLVVDDHPDTSTVLAVMFNLLGRETRTALRGRDALRAAREFDPELVVLDIGLPDLSGYEVVHALRATRRDRAIMAVSGWGRPEDYTRSLLAGFDRHYLKPIGIATVREMLRIADGRACADARC